MMSMVSSYVLPLWMLLASTWTDTALGHSSEHCNCEYDVPSEWEPECRVFGQLGDGHLIPWHPANQSCLDEWDVPTTAMDRDALWNICPFDNHTNANVQGLVDEIRYRPRVSTRAIQAFYSQFWIESNVNSNETNSHTLLDVIYDASNNPIDCVASEDACWNTILAFFIDSPKETTKACKDLHFQQIADLRLEQSIVRERLCSMGDMTYTAGGNQDSVASVSSLQAVASPCQALLSQIVTEKVENPDVECATYGQGPEEFFLKLPKCINGSVVSNGTPDFETSSIGPHFASVVSIFWSGVAVWIVGV